MTRSTLVLLLALLAAPASPARVVRPVVAPSTSAAALRALGPPLQPASAAAAALDASLSLDDGAKAQVQREACAAVLREFGVPRGVDIGGDDGALPPPADAADAQTTGGAARATVVLPSGAGKTVCALRVAEALRARLTLVLVPSVELVSQTHREWERWREPGALDQWRPLAVVSSTSVPAATLPRTTDVDEIGAFLRQADAAPRVLFCTYHSAARVAEALRLDGEAQSVDLLVRPRLPPHLRAPTSTAAPRPPPPRPSRAVPTHRSATRRTAARAARPSATRSRSSTNSSPRRVASFW